MKTLFSGIAIEQGYQEEMKFYFLVGEQEIGNGESEIKIYPNSVHDTLNFTLSNSSDFADVEVFDTSGRLVLSLLGKKNNVDVSSLSAGNYLVKINPNTNSDV